MHKKASALATRSIPHNVKMFLKVLIVAAFVLVMLQSIDSSGAHYPTGKNRPCCVETTERNISSQILGNTYSMQRSRSRCVEAILFITAKGTICVNPKASWIQTRIANMKKEG